jgi:iron complex transport system substrate-binding protein
MAADSTRVKGVATHLALVLALVWAGGLCSAPAPGAQTPPRAPARIVSLVPAVTEMLFAIGAGSQVAAVSSFDKFPPAVERLPRVGALLDPDTERILSLRPDLVVVYGSQDNVLAQLERARIATFVYRHGGLDQTLDTIVSVGQASGHGDQARKVVNGLRTRLDGIRRRVAGRPRPRTLLVVSREPGTLRGLYASGGVGFLHDLLELAGAANVFADVREESVQPSHETILLRRPEVVIELHPQAANARLAEARRAWSALASTPAVRDGRVHPLGGDYLVIAGPRLGEAAEALARAVHGR